MEDGFLSVLVGLLVGLSVFLILSAGSNNEFNRWTADCNRQGGLTSKTNSGILSSRYECFIDGKIVTLAGWEGK